MGGEKDWAAFDLEEVERGLVGSVFAGTVRHVVSTGSTNSLAVEAAQAGVMRGVWVADEQTAGRGRGGHGWESPAGEGLYVSVLMRPRLRGVDVLKISLGVGVAVVQAVDVATSARLELKWPNDVMDGSGAGMGKKVGGILTEAATGGDGWLQYAVIGIGLNLNQRAMPEELRDLASSLWISGLDAETRRETLLPVLLQELESEMKLLEWESAGEKLEYGVLARFEFASPMVRGMRVRVEEDGGYVGVTDGLEQTGLLRVRLEDGSVRVVRHGGVRAAE